LNNNINLPGFEGLTIKKTSEVDGTYQIHIEMEREPHTCPDCESITDRVHDYRSQKIQHTKIFSRNTVTKFCCDDGTN